MISIVVHLIIIALACYYFEQVGIDKTAIAVRQVPLCTFLLISVVSTHFYAQEEDTETLLAADFEIGHFMRERLIPRVS